MKHHEAMHEDGCAVALKLNCVCVFSSFHNSIFPLHVLMYLNMKVTLAEPILGTVHHRDISTKGAAVCLISPAQMGKQESHGQPKVCGPSLTSIVLMETTLSSRRR